MTGPIGSFTLWGRAIFFGVLASLNILKQVVTKGPRKILHWKQWTRPHYLDDPSFGTHGILTLKDVSIHYVASGPEDKPLMLFLHGFPEFWYSWRHQIREFQKDYRVVAIDQRGYSESSKPAGIHNYSLTKLTSDLEQVIQALGYKSCVLVAHDWGGLVAWSFGRNYSHLVDKLIVMNAPPFPVYNTIVQTNKEQARKSWYVFFFQLPFLPELVLKLQDFAFFDSLLPSKHKQGSDEADKAREENIAPYKYTFSQPGALTPPLNYYRHFMRNQSDNRAANHDLKYTMPTLLIWGCKDAALDETFPDTIEKEAPCIDVRRIPEANHFVQIDAPDEVNKIMRKWLGEH
jgi:pimeloyl-ACP methyl ester carboxylesterase